MTIEQRRLYRLNGGCFRQAECGLVPVAMAPEVLGPEMLGPEVLAPALSAPVVLGFVELRLG